MKVKGLSIRWLAAGLVATAFIAVNALFLLRHGIQLEGDSSRYLGGADNLLAGRPLIEKQASYLGFVALVGLAKLTGVGLEGLIALHLLLAALAVFAVFSLGRELRGETAGWIAAALLATNADLARWHSYVLTDSAYASWVVITAWGVHRAAEKKGLFYLTAALMVLGSALLRPNGWALVPATGVYWILRASRDPKLRAGALLLVFVAMLGLAVYLPAFREGIEQERPGVHLRNGEVLWHYTPARLPMPAAPELTETDWVSSARYVVLHPVACARLAITRDLVELAHVRPFYSLRHNLFILAWLPLVYLCALQGAWKCRHQPLAGLLGLFIAAHLGTIALTFADRDGRFLLLFLPLILAFSGAGAASLSGLFARGKESRSWTKHVQ